MKSPTKFCRADSRIRQFKYTKVSESHFSEDADEAILFKLPDAADSPTEFY